MLVLFLHIYTLTPIKADLRPSDLIEAYELFLQTAVALRERYSKQISLLIGLETDFITPLDSTGILSTLAKHGHTIDYVVGSVHHVNGVSIDFDRQTWLRAVRDASSSTIGRTMIPPDPELDDKERRPPLAQVSVDTSDPTQQSDYIPSARELIPFLNKYFDAQYDLFQQHQPEVIGHFDLCLLWTPAVSLRLEDFKSTWDRVERNVRFVIKYGGLFEANAAAFRKGWETSYPSREILEVSLSCSDATRYPFAIRGDIMLRSS